MSVFENIKNDASLHWEKQRKSENIKILVGAATCGVSVGALQVIEAFENEIKKYNISAKIIKVGCLGLCYAEPLVVIMKNGNPNVCYKNINPNLVHELVTKYLLEDDLCFDFALGILEGGEEEPAYIPELERFEREKRIILRYSGYINPEDIYDYVALGGYEGLNKALSMEKKEIIEEIKKSGLRGLGGAGYPTGLKMEMCANANSKLSIDTQQNLSTIDYQLSTKYVICNADEGDPGAFMDRVVLESSPHQVIEGMAISAFALAVNKGYIYVRMEYPLAISRFKIALEQAREKGLLGKNILEKGFNFDIEIIPGAGAFVCGESSALMYSIEGKRPMPRVRPPHSVIKGLFGKPTFLSNVKTYSCIPYIIKNGAKQFSSFGTERSKGTTVFALAGKVKNSGLAEVEMGTTLKDLIYKIGGGIKNDKKLKGILTGGPSGGCIPEKFIDTKVDFDSLQSLGTIMGSGGLIVLDEETCAVDVAKYFISFTQNESCGKCSFCRIGLKQMLLILQSITKGEGKLEDIDLLMDLAEDIKNGSLCGLGKTAPNPVLTTIKYFKDEYMAHIVGKKCPELVCRDLISYYIVPEKCYRGCDHCILKCPSEAIIKDEKGIKLVDQKKCIKCGNCKEVCPPEYDAVIKVSPVLDNSE